ncbi:MAG: hypothetical protein KGP28_03475 [Bdellovibrionales bacterium]|nr:hypothetical protein [Bdellovibrionales bacterium]
MIYAHITSSIGEEGNNTPKIDPRSGKASKETIDVFTALAFGVSTDKLGFKSCLNCRKIRGKGRASLKKKSAAVGL